MIYTKTGDRGETSLANGQRVSKADARIEAYGTADELNSFVGLLRAKISLINDPDVATIDTQLSWIQNRLFNLGALLSEAPGEWIAEEDEHVVERWIDAFQDELPPLRSFIIPGGSEAVSLCHVCRTITRRLERRISPIPFVNRLSDYFFVLSRKVAKMEKIEQFSWQK